MDSRGSDPADGYSYQPDRLRHIAWQVNQAALHLGGSVRDDSLATPDAGMSSEVVGAALQRVLVAGGAIRQAFTDISASVDAARGTYDEIENTNAGRVRLEGLAPAPEHYADLLESKPPPPPVFTDQGRPSGQKMGPY
ncbi:hypothetical protein [Actinophytocola sp.]|uniref:hypothetical protein n=1 Tax=Actinophytocola sp. TaxID=1872138 RepID=UPI003D6B2303